MKKSITYDFKKGVIKHTIEEKFYQYAGSVLGKEYGCSIVSGPDHLRHIENAEKYLTLTRTPVIYEIDHDIYFDIRNAYKGTKRVNVKLESIENAKTAFIDCDLTAVSDSQVIFNTLLSQIKALTTHPHPKVFIFTMSARLADEKTMTSAFRKILGLLGCYVSKFGPRKDVLCLGQNKYLKEFTVQSTDGRVEKIISYLYNAGGGPMYTCLIHYR